MSFMASILSELEVSRNGLYIYIWPGCMSYDKSDLRFAEITSSFRNTITWLAKSPSEQTVP